MSDLLLVALVGLLVWHAAERCHRRDRRRPADLFALPPAAPAETGGVTCV